MSIIYLIKAKEESLFNLSQKIIQRYLHHQDLVNGLHPRKHFCLAWSTRMDWDQLNCLSPIINNRPSTVRAAVDHRLAEGMTYLYQGMQTQIPQATVVWAGRISVLRDSKARSSRVLKTFLWQIMKCLDSTNDIKHFSGSFRYNVSLTRWCVSCAVTGSTWKIAIPCGRIKILSFFLIFVPPLCQILQHKIFERLFST